MLLREAKEILKKNGYRLVEDTEDPEEEMLHGEMLRNDASHRAFNDWSNHLDKKADRSSLHDKVLAAMCNGVERIINDFEPRS